MTQTSTTTIHDRHTAVGEAARLDDELQQTVIAAAKALLHVIDVAPIRMAAIACGAELYECAGDLIDAIARAEANG